MALVLLAEDNEDIAFSVQRVLRRAGFTTVHAPDGTAALELAGTSHPDVLLTDLGMPGMDGLALCRALRAHASLAGTPAAIISGSLLPGDPSAAEAGVCAVLLKPCPNDAIVVTVRRLAELGPHSHGDPSSPCPLD